MKDDDLNAFLKQLGAPGWAVDARKVRTIQVGFSDLSIGWCAPSDAARDMFRFLACPHSAELVKAYLSVEDEMGRRAMAATCDVIARNFPAKGKRG